MPKGIGPITALKHGQVNCPHFEDPTWCGICRPGARMPVLARNTEPIMAAILRQVGWPDEREHIPTIFGDLTWGQPPRVVCSCGDFNCASLDANAAIRFL